MLVSRTRTAFLNVLIVGLAFGPATRCKPKPVTTTPVPVYRTNASVRPLVLRAQADPNSAVTGALPYGARVRVWDLKGKRMERQLDPFLGDVSGRWYKLGPNSWGFSGYLVNDTDFAAARDGQALVRLLSWFSAQTRIPWHGPDLRRQLSARFGRPRKVTHTLEDNHHYPGHKDRLYTLDHGTLRFKVWHATKINKELLISIEVLARGTFYASLLEIGTPQLHVVGTYGATMTHATKDKQTRLTYEYAAPTSTSSSVQFTFEEGRLTRFKISHEID